MICTPLAFVVQPNFLFHNHNDDKSRSHNHDFIFNREDSCDGQQSTVLAGSVIVTRIWLIISVGMDPPCVKEAGGLWGRPLWTHTVPLLLINEHLSPSPLMTVKGAVGGSPSTAQSKEDAEEPGQF